MIEISEVVVRLVKSVKGVLKPKSNGMNQFSKKIKK